MCSLLSKRDAVIVMVGDAATSLSLTKLVGAI
jgi:hypothetical protein